MATQQVPQTSPQVAKGIRIILARPEGDENPGKLVMVNGRSYTVAYNKEHTVPLEVYHALKDACTSITRKNKDGYDEPVEVPRFTVHEV